MIRKIVIIVLALSLSGCASIEKPKVKYVIETGSPDVWETNPSQRLSAKVEISH
jgi:uncharacterized lipoprotein YmbA